MRTRPYVVRSGDYLTSIAHSVGQPPNVIWKDPDNAALRQLRDNPELLAPGDVLYVPVVPPKWLPVQVGATNSYKATVPTVTVHVVLKDFDGTPLAGKAVETEPPLGTDPLSTDGSGTLTLEVPITIKYVLAKIADPQHVFEIRVGYLDPHDVTSGAKSRLRQLGYVGDELGLLRLGRWYMETFDEDAPLRCGVAAFQEDQGTDVTGDLDDDCTDKLKSAYGL